MIRHVDHNLSSLFYLLIIEQNEYINTFLFVNHIIQDVYDTI
jgi:hypothetical protein